MNTFTNNIENKVNDLAQTLKVQLAKMSSLSSGQELLEFEQTLENLCQKASGELLGFSLQTHLSNPELRRAAIDALHAHGKKWRSKGLREVRIRLASGIIVAVKTPYFVQDRRGQRGRKRKKRGKKGSGCYPVLKALGIHERITPAAIEKLLRTVTICSSLAESREQLAKNGMKLNIKTIRTLAWEFGWRGIEAHLARLGEWFSKIADNDSPFAGQRVVVTIDGGRIRLRTPTKRGRPKKNGRRSFQTDWFEPRVICLYLMDDKGKKLAKIDSCWYDASLSDADESFELLEAHLTGLGIKKAKSVVFTSDGAKWIWSRVKKLWETLGVTEKVTEVLDFYHAAEHLHEIAELRKDWTAAKRKKWFTKMRGILREGRIEVLKEEVKSLATTRKKKEYQKKWEYFEGHQERMRYAQFSDANLPLGSGAVESAVRRIINQRLKGPGIIWLESSAQAMLLLRAYLKAGRWDEFIQMMLANLSKMREV